MENILFCSFCGSFREITCEENMVTCRQCDQTISFNQLTSNLDKIVQVIPVERSELLLNLYGHTREKATTEEAIIDEPCPKCSHPQLSFHTAQLRGIDEGQTIFYTCLKKACGHKFSVNS